MNRRRRFMVVLANQGDTTAPTCVITSAATSPTLDSPVAVTITFSEAVTGFAVGDIAISAGGSLASFTAVSASVYTVVWTLAAGANTMDVPAGVCQDAGGNDNEAAAQFAMTYGITPSITPALESELFLNGTFGSDANWIKGTGWAISDGVAAGTTTTDSIRQTPFVAGNWYWESWDLLTITAGRARAFLGASGNLRDPPATYLATNRAANTIGGVTGGGAGFSGTIDNVSGKKITFSSMLELLGDINRKNGAYFCHPTAALDSQCGMVIEYADANNLVLVYVDRYSNKAQLDKLIGGVWTNVINGAITYSAAAELKVVVNGNDHSLYYGGVQVGSTTAINDAGLGTAVYGFNSLDGNTVGLVTTSP